MKLSISLADEDVAVLDDYVRRAGLQSRSAGVQRAIRALRHPTLEADYRDAWAEWSATGDNDGWEAATGDGVGDVAG